MRICQLNCWRCMCSKQLCALKQVSSPLRLAAALRRDSMYRQGPTLHKTCVSLRAAAASAASVWQTQASTL
jgi:hypothetical protein